MGKVSSSSGGRPPRPRPHPQGTREYDRESQLRDRQSSGGGLSSTAAAVSNKEVSCPTGAAASLRACGPRRRQRAEPSQSSVTCTSCAPSAQQRLKLILADTRREARHDVDRQVEAADGHVRRRLRGAHRRRRVDCGRRRLRVFPRTRIISSTAITPCTSRGGRVWSTDQDGGYTRRGQE